MGYVDLLIFSDFCLFFVDVAEYSLKFSRIFVEFSSIVRQIFVKYLSNVRQIFVQVPDTWYLVLGTR